MKRGVRSECEIKGTFFIDRVQEVEHAFNFQEHILILKRSQRKAFYTKVVG